MVANINANITYSVQYEGIQYVLRSISYGIDITEDILVHWKHTEHVNKAIKALLNALISQNQRKNNVPQVLAPPPDQLNCSIRRE